MLQQLWKLADWQWVAGRFLVAGGALYAFFWGSFLVGNFGDDLWLIGLAVHGVLIFLIIAGLVAARSRLRLEGWASWVWNTSIAFAFLGQTVGHPMWSLALFGLAGVGFTKLGSAVAASLAAGGLGWLALFWSGVRVGDQDGPTPTDGQVVLGLIALMLTALGLIGLGVRLRRAVTSADLMLQP